MPSKQKNVGKEILLLDFELFIGGKISAPSATSAAKETVFWPFFLDFCLKFGIILTLYSRSTWANPVLS